MTEQVSARTLRRMRSVIENRLETLAEQQKALHQQREADRVFLESVVLHTKALAKHVERLVAEKHALERAVETLKQVPHLTGWTKEQEASLIMGLSDAQLRRAAIEAQNEA